MEPALIIKEYIIRTILGSERALHRTKHVHTDTEKYRFISMHGVCEYFTRTYNSVIKRDDPVVNQIYDEFYRIAGQHSPHCLIIGIGARSVGYSAQLVRDDINKSLEDYDASIRAQLERIISVDHLREMISHTCNGPPVSKMRPVPAGELLISFEVTNNA